MMKGAPWIFGLIIFVCTKAGDADALKNQQPGTTSGLSLQDACLYEAASFATNECSSQCQQGGETACKNCISNAEHTPECIKISPFKCLTCIPTVANAVRKCIQEFSNPVKIVQCIKENVPARCVDCVCKLGCSIYPPICVVCLKNQQPGTTSGLSLQEACLYEATSLATNQCSSQCQQGGERACQNCISKGDTPECARISSDKCAKCIGPVLKAFLKCKNEYQTPADILNCIIGNVPASCAPCSCKLGCTIYAPICRLC